MQKFSQNWVRIAISRGDRNVWIATTAIVVAAAAIAKWLNQNIGYANGAGCDSWYFFGIYQDYFHLRSWLADAYQFNRFPALLPWIFLGPRISATTLVELKFWTYFLISAGCFCYAAITLFGARIGPLISILFLGSTLFIGVLSTDYVTGAGLALECGLIATLIRAANSDRPSGWLLLTGGLFACCIFTHIPMAAFIFSTPLYLLLRKQKFTVKKFARFIIWMIAGFLAITVILCLTSVALNGNFLFFENEILSAIHYVGSNYYGRPIADNVQWFSFDANIPMFLLAVAASLFTLIRLGFERTIKALSNLAIPALIYLAVAIVCFGFEFSGRMILQENVYAPWMLPPAFLAVGSALSLAKVSNRALYICLGLAAACVLVWAAGRMNPGIDYRWRYILAAAALLSLALPFRAWSTMLATTCVLGLLAIDYPTGYGALSWYPAQWSGEALYKSVQRADRFVTHNSTNTRPLFWVSGDIKGLDDLLFVSIATPRSYLQCGRFPASYPSLQVSNDSWDQYFPDLPAAVRDHYISPGRRLFIIARGHDLVASASAAFQSVGLRATALNETEIAPGVSIAVADIK